VTLVDAATLDAARTEANGTLGETCEVTRASTLPPQKLPSAGRAPAADTVVHTGPCSVSFTTTTLVTGGTTGGTAYTVIVRVPHDVTGIMLGDVVKVTGVRDGGNTELLGVRLKVAELPLKSTTVLRRLHCALIAPTGATP
jgi:uncharacterized protein DUF6093